jgi:hypothetical protein
VASPNLTGYLCEQCSTRRRWRSWRPRGAARWASARRVAGSHPPSPPRPGLWCRPALCAPNEDATTYIQHCYDTGHPLRPGAWQLRPGVRISLRA